MLATLSSSRLNFAWLSFTRLNFAWLSFARLNFARLSFTRLSFTSMHVPGWSHVAIIAISAGTLAGARGVCQHAAICATPSRPARGCGGLRG